ncbi:MAG TPA: hypothetical protein VNQ79_25025 [Blastocatellia bacterium]|nr:hypothetical protein [Blastocatellia bacterium]
MSFSRSYGSFLCRALAGVLVCAQISWAAQQPQDEAQKRQQVREQNALALLDELLTETSSLRLPENRVSFQAAAATLLWKRDQARARRLYREATAGLMEMLSVASAQTEDEAEEIGYPARAFWEQLRFKLLSSVAEQDVKLAQELLLASRPPEAVADPDARDTREKEFELRLAARLADSDPLRAYQMAEEKLAGGARDAAAEVMEFLQKLVEKDPALATRLARSLLRKIQADDSATQGPPYLLSRLLTIISAPAANPPKDEQKDDKAKPAQIDEAVIRETVEAMTAQLLAMLTGGRQNNFQRSEYAWFALSELQRLMPLAEKYLPARVPAIRARLAEMEKGMPPEMRSMREMDALFQKGDMDAVLAAAAKLPPDQGQFLYYRVAEDAINKGDLDKAKRIMAEKLREPAVRKQLEVHMEQRAMQAALEKGRFDEVRPLMERVRSTRERVGILTQMAGAELSKGNKKAAQQLLDEARNLIGSRAANRAQLEAQLMLAGGYAEIDPTRSFELLEAATSRINELLTAAAGLGGFFPVSPSREDELVLVEESGGVFTELLHQHADAVEALLTADFDHIKSVIAGFQRPEVRAFVRLAVVDNVLAHERSKEARATGVAAVGGTPDH